MNILVIGGGGREHALAWALAKSPRVARVYVAPGNAGTAQEEGVINLAANDIASWIVAAKEYNIQLAVVGPEAPLAAGVVDAFNEEKIPIFGPSKAAAQLESSKIYAKSFMDRHHIPTAKWQMFEDIDRAKQYLKAQSFSQVIKADGLAAGKGVVVPQNLSEAEDAIEAMLGRRQFGEAGARILIEECLPGVEVSFIVMCRGEKCVPLAPCQDFKRLKEEDKGPNTGGMGALCPSPRVTPRIHANIMQRIVNPTLRGLKDDGIFYQGFLYFGLMLDNEGMPRVLEFNCRLGDPETQPLLFRLRSDLLDLLQKVMKGDSDDVEIKWDHRPALGVVLAAQGYPEDPRLGAEITLPTQPHSPDKPTHIFHAATRVEDGKLRVSGGRVMCVTALGETLKSAQDSVYHLASQVHFAGMQFRRDIGNNKRSSTPSQK